MELLNERLRDADPAQRVFALGEIKKEVAGATQSMTSVPKPLKFLSQHYKGMRDYYNTLAPSDFKVSPLLTKFYRYNLQTWCQSSAWSPVMKAPTRA
jgi:hypothetical protein